MRPFAEYFSAPARASAAATGLFGIKGVNSPAGLTQFARSALVTAQSLARELQAGPGREAPRAPPGKAEIAKLDELSDTLCRVVDLAAFLRIAHPSPKMAAAAQQAHELLFGFMSELNTSRPLFRLVAEALANPAVDGEARKVGEILHHDFLKSGLQFDRDPRRQHRFVELPNDISVRGQAFLMGCGQPPAEDLVLDPQELAGVSPVLRARLAVPASLRLRGQVRVPRDQPHIAEHILATAARPETRRKVWHYLRSAPAGQIALLDAVLRDRQELAGLAGYASYADYELGDKLMQTSANASAFLTGLARTVAPLARRELAGLGPGGGPQAPWDYAYCLAQHRGAMRRAAAPPTFELAAVFDALATLAHRLYNLRLEPGEVADGEVWAPEVRRLDVFDGATKVGMIYCDLLSRPGKQPNPAHFTIQCSRRRAAGPPQLPIIALVCDFAAQPPRLLQFAEVQTLFHEMGHALHSMVGRTELHNVSGTRCATDFVELPSILFEKFASHPEVLAMMKPGLDAPRFLAQQARVDRVSEYWEVWHQLGLSFLDQALHGEPFARLRSSQAVSDLMTRQHSLYPAAPMQDQCTQQFAHFGHLVSYGATYYSYLFDRCLAAMTWDLLFKNPRHWDEGGHKFKTEVLRWGGARDPRTSIESLFGRELDHAAIAASLALN